MTSLCQRCTGEDDARHQIDITSRPDGGSGPESLTTAHPVTKESARSPANTAPLGSQDAPSPSPASPISSARKNGDAATVPQAPNAQVIGGTRANKAEKDPSPGRFESSTPTSKADSESAKKKKGAEEEYCLCFPYRHRVEEDEALQRGCWCMYCCCMGCALHRLPSPLQLRSHCMCIEQTCETQEVDGISGGPWACINTCCFCTSLCLFPRRLGHPRCICCNEDCCGVVGGYAGAQSRSTPEDRGLSAYDHALYEQFVPCYCCCMGLGITPAFVSVLNSFSKCFCCMVRISTGAPDFEGCELCLNMLNCWCCVGHCRFIPELRKNPICALFGWRYKKWRSKPGDTDREEYVDSANEIHCDFPLGVYDDAREHAPHAPGLTPYKENPRERWRDIW